MRLALSALERLIIAALRLNPYQTSDELYMSVGSAARKHFRERLEVLVDAGEIKVTPDGYHYVLDAEQPPHFLAILNYLGSGKAPYGELAHAEHEIRCALTSHRRDTWGRAFPGGLNHVELQRATRHSMAELTAGLERMVNAGDVVTMQTDTGARYRLAEAVQA